MREIEARGARDGEPVRGDALGVLAGVRVRASTALARARTVAA
jgi:hypothetical protein